MRRRKLDVILVRGVENIERTVKEVRDDFKGRKIKIEITELSIIEDEYYLTVWEVK